MLQQLTHELYYRDVINVFQKKPFWNEITNTLNVSDCCPVCVNNAPKVMTDAVKG